MTCSDSPNVLALACKPIPIVRIALIGLGKRGLKTIQRYGDVDGAEIVALADLQEEHLEAAQRILQETGRDRALQFVGKEAARAVCELAHVDLIMVCTDWFSHTALAVMAMQCGKHVAVEVPACMEVDECWRIVRVSELTQRHCFILENCCFDPFALSTLHMAEEGLLGHLKHCEGAYIHDLYTSSQEAGVMDPVYAWMEGPYPYHYGNAYPTHGLGPIGHLLHLHRGDRMDYLYSMGSVTTDSLPRRINNTLIKTVQGRSILLQLDLHTPRPYSRLQSVCGDNGYVSKYPRTMIQLRTMSEALYDEQALSLAQQYQHPISAQFVPRAQAKGVDNIMNYTMDARLIYCLQHGLPLDIDVYDAAEWSCIAALSALSEAENRPITVPDFTRGHYAVLDGPTFYM